MTTWLYVCMHGCMSFVTHLAAGRGHERLAEVVLVAARLLLNLHRQHGLLYVAVLVVMCVGQARSLDPFSAIAASEPLAGRQAGTHRRP